VANGNFAASLAAALPQAPQGVAPQATQAAPASAAATSGAATPPSPATVLAGPQAPAAPGASSAAAAQAAAAPTTAQGTAQAASGQGVVVAAASAAATPDQVAGAALAPSAALDVQIAAASEPQREAPLPDATAPADVQAQPADRAAPLTARPALAVANDRPLHNASAADRPQSAAPQAPDAAATRAAGPAATPAASERAEAADRFADVLADTQSRSESADASAPSPTAKPVDPTVLPAADPARNAPAQADPVHGARLARAVLPVTQQVSIHLTKAIADGVDRINIQLSPVELGRIDVRLDIGDDGNVRAVFNADRPQTVELLQRDARELTRAFQDSGLKADSGSLNFNLREQGRDSQQGFAYVPERAGTTNSDSGERPLATPRYAAPNGANGRLDIRV
jgi:hypothetical protein